MRSPPLHVSMAMLMATMVMDDYNNTEYDDLSRAYHPSETKQSFLLELQLTLGYLRHYCLIDSVTCTDPLDPYRKLFVPVSVLLHLYHLFYATTEHHVYKSYSSC
jgi:hypothetical protein